MCVREPSTHRGDCAEHPEPYSVKRTPLRRPPRSPLINYTRTHVPEQHFSFCAPACACMCVRACSVPENSLCDLCATMCVSDRKALRTLPSDKFFASLFLETINRASETAQQSSRTTRTYIARTLRTFQKGRAQHASGAG